jgi:5-methylcytosine-specific restriction endonuclease McrA
MKTCKGCSKLVKNSYNYCFKCNDIEKHTEKEVKEDNSSDIEVIPYKKETIPKCVRNALWINFFGDKREGKCQCCKRETISIGNFHAGHIVAEINGGSTSLENLTPLCQLCNTSMGRYNVQDFITKYNLHFGL